MIHICYLGEKSQKHPNLKEYHLGHYAPSLRAIQYQNDIESDWDYHLRQPSFRLTGACHLVASPSARNTVSLANDPTSATTRGDASVLSVHRIEELNHENESDLQTL